jgi:glycosyltransferase involved in cell wall biosynthesis
MTILFLISSQGYFGVENMLVTLAVALQNAGCRCIVGVFSDSRSSHIEVAEHARQRGLTTEIICCAGRLDLRAVTRIRTLAAVYSVDVIHTHGYKADVYARAATSTRQSVLVATCHNWPSSEWKMRIYAALDRLLLKGFDRIAVISDAVAETLQRSGVRPPRLQTIPNGVEIERFRNASPVLRKELEVGEAALVGFVGRLVPGKGGEILLHAAEQVLAVIPKTKFVFVGDGPSRRDWEVLAAQLRILNKVVFTGVREDMPSVYASLDLLVLPSVCEAMPMCVLEAMAAGRPVVATRVGAVPKMVAEEHTGFLVEAGEIDTLAKAILRALNDPARAREMGANGQARVSKHFSSDAMAAQYVALYRGVLDKRKRSMNTFLFTANDTHNHN